jgi:hypothetical protein
VSRLKSDLKDASDQIQLLESENQQKQSANTELTNLAEEVQAKLKAMERAVELD